MKIAKMMIATLALSAAMVTSAHAHDSFNIGINIGGYGYAPHSIVTHRHAPAYYGYYGAPTVYYHAPRVVYYAPPVGYHHFRQHSYNNNHHFNRHGQKHYRQHQERGRGNRR